MDGTIESKRPDSRLTTYKFQMIDWNKAGGEGCGLGAADWVICKECDYGCWLAFDSNADPTLLGPLIQAKEHAVDEAFSRNHGYPKAVSKLVVFGSCPGSCFLPSIWDKLL